MPKHPQPCCPDGRREEEEGQLPSPEGQGFTPISDPEGWRWSRGTHSPPNGSGHGRGRLLSPSSAGWGAGGPRSWAARLALSMQALHGAPGDDGFHQYECFLSALWCLGLLGSWFETHVSPAATNVGELILLLTPKKKKKEKGKGDAKSDRTLRAGDLRRSINIAGRCLNRDAWGGSSSTPGKLGPLGLASSIPARLGRSGWQARLVSAMEPSRPLPGPQCPWVKAL